jgi:hypothetical protein
MTIIAQTDPTFVTLEETIDKHDLDEVLQAISAICSEKASHLATNWQDHKTAALWEKSATAVLKCALSKPVQDVNQ